MPRRAAASATPAIPSSLTNDTLSQQLDDPFAPQVSLLRRQWKWAAFSQFFYTFTTLFAMPDVSLSDIEDDLTRSTSIVIHRVMHRLLVTATQDRKMSLENWQTSLRKQYKKRDPDLNPIGPEPVAEHPTPAPDSPDADDDGEHKTESESVPGSSSELLHGDSSHAEAMKDDDHPVEPDIPKDFSHDIDLDEMKVESACTPATLQPESQEESKDWLTLPMLTKLDSLHLLTEWQFHNVNRIRTIMKDDDEAAQWRIEPIGYDSKANAYWLIGPDRLWIQRTMPKPPRNLKRKRTLTRPKPKPDAAFTDDESDAPSTPKKRKAAGTIRITPSSSHTPTRPTRPRRPPSSSPNELGPIASRGPRAAKTQASAKLSAQAKELAELQRQAAMEGRRSNRRVASPSPTQRASSRRLLGTRMSARLRGATQVEDGWQEIPDEWLKDSAEENDDASASERDKVVEMGVNSEHRPEPEPDPETELDEDMGAQTGKTGLESDDDAVSELTELSEITPPVTVVATHPTSKRSSKKSGGTRKKSSQSRTTIEASVPEDENEPEWHPPDDFVEWETICVTLSEWEHICERFQGATHYAERALYKLLSQQIVPAIAAELREIQRKRHLEEAVSHRKRSSRLAVKENEKEEARQVAIKKAEEDEKLSRARRLEARLKREEEERLKREAAREKRRLDREERERKAQTGEEQQSNPGLLVDVVGDGSLPRNALTIPPKARPGRPKTKALTQASSSTSASGSRTPVGEDWVLDCDICHRTGVNKDDGSPLLCCGKCSKWQHIACHDLADRQAGRPKRDWDREEFVCRACQDRSTVNGRQSLNGSGSYDATRTPNPYPQSAYTSPVPYNSAYPPHTPRSPYQRHTAITFTHYQPQQHGFSSTHALHAQSMLPAAASTYNQAPFSPSKSAHYAVALQQYPSHSYSNGTNWPSPAPHAQSSASHTPQHLQTSYPASSYSPSAERSSMSSAYPQAAQNGSTTLQSQSWRGSSYVAPVGGVSSYYPQNAQPQPPQHRAP